MKTFVSYLQIAKRHLGQVLAVAFVLLLFFWTRGGNFDQLWMQRWAILLLGAAVFYAAYVGEFISWCFAPFVFTTLASGIAAAFWFNRYSNRAMEQIAVGITKLGEFSADDKWAMQAVLRQDASRAIFAFLLLALAVRLISIRTASLIRTTLGLLGFVEAVLIIVQAVKLQHPEFWVPFFDNPSMGGSFVALSIFILCADIYEYVRKPWRPLLYFTVLVWCLTAIFLTRTSTPLVGLTGGVLGYWFAHRMRLRREPGPALLGLLAVVWVPVLAGYFIQGSEVFNDNSRFRMWGWTLDFFYRQNWFTSLIGFGTGTMRTFMPLAEVEHGMDTGWFFWLHNDWLQVLPEQGWLGFAAFLTAAAELYRRTWRWPAFSAMLGCFGAVMLTDFPLHWPVFILALGVIARPFVEPKTSMRY